MYVASQHVGGEDGVTPTGRRDMRKLTGRSSKTNNLNVYVCLFVGQAKLESRMGLDRERLVFQLMFHSQKGHNKLGMGQAAWHSIQIPSALSSAWLLPEALLSTVIPFSPLSLPTSARLFPTPMMHRAHHHLLGLPWVVCSLVPGARLDEGGHPCWLTESCATGGKY